MPTSLISPNLERPTYAYSEVDHIARATKGTAKRWLEGYTYRRNGRRISQPPVTPGTGGANAATFLDLVEVVAIARLEDSGFTLRNIREIVDNCIELLGVQRPLATQRFKLGGRDIFVDQGANLLEVGRRKRLTAWSDVLEPFLEELDYAGDWAERWWPLGKSVPVQVDPDFGFGQPVIAGTGIRTEILLEQFLAGETMEEIADQFRVSKEDVSQAIRFEVSLTA